jgi:hypothetical protein
MTAMSEKNETSDPPLPDGQTVFEIGNVTFLDIGIAFDYSEAHGLDLIEAATTRFVRYGISKRPHFTRPSAPT